MHQEIEIINPLNYPGWDELVLTTKNYSFFHSSAWARVLHESYGYKPLYFTSIVNGRVLALIPVMEIKSLLTGKRAVSLPFTDHCEPIFAATSLRSSEGCETISKHCREEEILVSFLNNLIAYGKKATWKSLELRFGTSLSQQILPSYTCYGHTLDISRKDDEIFSTFRDSTKRNIKKAIKEGVKVGIFHSLKSVREFYRLNCMTRKEHGLPPQPYLFFENVYKHVLSKSKGMVVLASYGDSYIAGAIYFHFGERTIYKYGASCKEYQHLRANNLVMWEAIKWYLQNGYKSFCFGRTETENDGLLQFKRGWGTEEWTLNYYKYDIKNEIFVSGTPNLSGVHNKIFYNMPISLLKITGSLLYKHIG